MLLVCDKEFTVLAFDQSTFQVNEFVEGFHDSILLYTHALNSHLAAEGDPKDGLAITNLMRNVSIPGEIL